MIELFINNQEVLIPEDISFTLIEENPEITNNGEFTLDITLSLLETKNAIAFGFLNRLNNLTITKNADARMIIDGSVRNGHVIITSNTDIDVTFQFVAGNSELNYIAKNEKKIWSLDWGTEDTIDFTKAYQSINYVGYGSHHISFGYDIQINYVCAPVKISGTIYNDFKLTNQFMSPQVPMTEVDRIIMQPYLLYYINMLPTLLGYSLKHNVLNNDSRASIMYILNSVNTLNYADALPDITVSEFIEAVEGFFNVEFLVNKSDKSISIENIESNLLNKKTVMVDQVLDAYIRDLSQDTKSIRFDFTKIKYDLPSSSTYFKYQQLSDDMLAKCKICEFDNFAALKNFIVVSGEFINQLYIYRDKETQNDYFYGVPSINLYSLKMTTDLTKYLNLINKFSTVGNSDDRILELKITPAEITINKKLVSLTINEALINSDVAYQLPVCSSSYFIAVEQGFVDSVESGTKTITRSNSIEVALFTGMLHTFNVNWEFKGGYVNPAYPFSHTDNYPDVGQYGTSTLRFDDFEVWKNTYFMPYATKNMRIKGVDGILANYHQESILDTTKEYTFTLIDGPDVNANNIFVINNLKYMPISFEREKSYKQKTVKGTFYRMLV